MALKKRIIRGYWASLLYRRRLKRLAGGSPPVVDSVFTHEFTSEFEGRPVLLALKFSNEFTSEHS